MKSTKVVKEWKIGKETRFKGQMKSTKIENKLKIWKGINV